MNTEKELSDPVMENTRKMDPIGDQQSNLDEIIDAKGHLEEVSTESIVASEIKLLVKDICEKAAERAMKASESPELLSSASNQGKMFFKKQFHDTFRIK